MPASRWNWWCWPRRPAIGSRPACRSPSPRPFLGLLLGLEPLALGATTLTLLVGTPALTLVGTVGAALAAAFGRGGILIAVLVLPFTIPVLIFGVSAAMAAVTEPQPFLPPFLILCALTLVSAVVAAVAGAAALRVGLE